jgi:hypothetical protein
MNKEMGSSSKFCTTLALEIIFILKRLIVCYSHFFKRTIMSYLGHFLTSPRNQALLVVNNSDINLAKRRGNPRAAY